MGLIEQQKHVKLGSVVYTIFPIMYKNKQVPILLDYKDFKYIKNLNKSWYINDSGAVVCHHNINGNTIELYLHEIIMALKIKDNGTERIASPIIHINRLGIDNRRDNLIYDVVDKEINKNLRKKKRIIIMPKNSKINPNNIPTYVWYMKPDETHNERFLIEIGDISWKTTSSSKYSLRYKLEEAKKFLRELKLIKPELFDEYSMNGEFNYDGKKMLESFHKLVQNGGFILNKLNNNNLTDKYLKEDLSDLTDYEIEKLKAFKLKQT